MTVCGTHAFRSDVVDDLAENKAQQGHSPPHWPGVRRSHGWRWSLMTRWLTALLGCTLFLAGCPQEALPPEPPEPPSPIVVVPDDRRDDSADDAEEQTRHRALRVMAAEQRNIVNTLDQQTRFVRTSTRMTERVRAALIASESELTSIDRAIDALGRDDSLSPQDRHERQDELKVRLRRLASRLALMETALREG
jgi:hypothetical protein